MKPIAPPAGQIPVSVTDAVASSLGYQANAKDIDAKKFPQRKSPNAKDRFCRGCANYTSANEAWGKCAVLSGLVSAQGWCGAWAKRGG